MGPLYGLHELYLKEFSFHYRVLLIIMLFYIILIITIPLLTIGVRALRRMRQRRRMRIIEFYKADLFNYLIDQAHPAAILNMKCSKLKKNQLIDVIYELKRYMTGEDRILLLALADKLELGDYAKKKVASLFCYKKVYYLKRSVSLSFLDIPEKQLDKNMHSRNVNRRLYAMQALMHKSPDRIIPLLNGYRFKLTLWEQMNLYDFFLSLNVSLPDFHLLAFSPNSSVIVFAIRMVRVFYQKRGSIVGYESLLHHPDLQVQGEMFRTMAEFGYSGLEKLFEHFIWKYHSQIQSEIITYLARYTPMRIDDLMAYFYENQSVVFRMHVLYCLYNFMEGGKEKIMYFINQKEDKELSVLSNHLVTNVI